MLAGFPMPNIRAPIFTPPIDEPMKRAPFRMKQIADTGQQGA